MAVTVVSVQRFDGCSIWDITDDDGTAVLATITHLLPAVPVEITLCPLLLAFYPAQWFVATATSTVVTLTKTNDVASAGATAQVRVILASLRTIQSLPGR